MRIYKCDLCKEEMKSQDFRNIQNGDHKILETCPKCVDKVQKFINSIIV